MLEYSINVRTDGSAAIARDKWNKEEDFEHRSEKPFLFEVGQKVVDILSKPGCCPEWNIRVAENGNTYRYTEIAGIFVREITRKELEALLSGCDAIATDKDKE